MIEAVIIMGGLGVVIGAALAAASKVFYVYVDPKIEAVEATLPGANCGGCGLPGCSANAAAIVQGKAAPNSCVAAGPEVAEAIAAILGVAIEAKEPDIARPGCTFGVQDADLKYIYNGLSDCRAAALLSGGMKVCSVGCMGLGSCMRACPFNAISMGPEGLPVVDETRCTGCGTCERVCPKHIITLSSVTRRILKEYTTEECTTPCQRGCPAGINIREYIRQITLGDYHRSVQVIKERNPFPTVIGRICPRPCELNCRRQYVDEPVAINFLKRFVADYEKDTGKRVLPYKAPETGKKIAVIGGGVQGLSTAFFSARLGHDATVFEAAEKTGGLLRSAISRYRLSEDILDWDIEGIVEMGVTIQTEKALGKDFTIESLLGEGFEAVFLASGGWDSRLIRGADAMEQPIPDTFLLIDLIKADAARYNKIPCKSDVVIVGGGKLALDAAKICKDLGSQNITVLFREKEDDMAIKAEDMASAREEGINIIFSAGVTRLIGEENQLTQVEYADLDTSEKSVVAAETLFISSGRFPELIFRKIKEETEEGEEATEAAPPNGPICWEAFESYKQPANADETGLFAEGDTLTDHTAAIKAIGAGRRGAASVHQLLYDIELALPENVISCQSVVQNVEDVEDVKPAPRQLMPLCSPKELPVCGEVEKGFSERMAQTEASRCLQCGLICYEHTGGEIAEKKESAA